MPFATTLPKAPPGGHSAGTSLDEQLRMWVGESFPALQAAWSSGAIDRLEPYLSSRLRDHLTRELDALRRDGLVNRVEDARLEAVTPLSRSRADAIVEVVFSARDWLADITTGAVVDGSEHAPADFRQRWYLLRGADGRPILDQVKPS